MGHFVIPVMMKMDLINVHFWTYLRTNQLQGRKCINGPLRVTWGAPRASFQDAGFKFRRVC